MKRFAVIIMVVMLSFCFIRTVVASGMDTGMGSVVEQTWTAWYYITEELKAIISMYESNRDRFNAWYDADYVPYVHSRIMSYEYLSLAGEERNDIVNKSHSVIELTDESIKTYMDRHEFWTSIEDKYVQWLNGEVTHIEYFESVLPIMKQRIEDRNAEYLERYPQ